MSMPHAAATKAEESKHKSSKAAKMTKTEKKEKMYHNPNTRNEEYHAMKKKKKEEDKKKKEEGKWQCNEYYVKKVVEPTKVDANAIPPAAKLTTRVLRQTKTMAIAINE